MDATTPADWSVTDATGTGGAGARRGGHRRRRVIDATGPGGTLLT
ncbi:hypothetical protein [Streptomyces sp. NPDC060027]